MTKTYSEIPQKILLASDKNKYGQYFTPQMVAEFMVDLAELNEDSQILEPSSGEGIFLKILKERGFHNLTAFEIDKELYQDFDFVRNESFISASLETQFDLVIGNPPYIRWKNLEVELKEELIQNPLWNQYFNSLCDYLYIFILKSIEILKDDGQLIFICPEYWMNTTHSISLRNYMVQKGYFEQIYHFNETPIFDNANVSIIIFKYRKGKEKLQQITVNKYYKNKKLTEDILGELKAEKSENNFIEKFKVKQFEANKRWLLIPEEQVNSIEQLEKACYSERISQDLFSDNDAYVTIGDICEIGNGLVSGLDKAFQLNGKETLNDSEKAQLIKIIKAKNLEPYIYQEITNYIFIDKTYSEDEFQEYFPNFYQKLKSFKEKLEKRYQYNRQIHYWEWVFLRNYQLFSSNQERIFVPCKERISNKNYFRFTYVEAGIFPTQDVTAIFPKEGIKESIFYILAFLNNHRVFNWLKNKGVIKGNIVEFSEKPIASIPFKKINWKNEEEVSSHKEITELTKSYIQKKDEVILSQIDTLFDKLLIVKDAC